MVQSITIDVVELEGEKLFKVNDLKFDKLDAIWGLEGGKLEIIRDGKILAQTSDIDWYGTHAETICFHGLAAPWRDVISGVAAKDFEVGDILKLSNIDDATNLEYEIRRSAIFTYGMESVFAKHHGQSIPIFGFLHEVGEELDDQTIEKFTTAPVIRFLSYTTRKR